MSSDQWTSDSARYVAPPAGGQTDVWAGEAAAHGQKGTQHIAEVSQAVPPPAVAQSLGIAPEGAVVVRRRVMYLEGRPAELTDSYFPLAVANGTGLAEPRKIRGGAVALLAELGYTAATVVEEVECRPPSAQEQAALQLEDGEWVLVLTRTSRTAESTPFEADIMTMPARRQRLRYEIRRG